MASTGPSPLQPPSAADWQRVRILIGKGPRAEQIREQLNCIQQERKLETLGDTIDFLIQQWRRYCSRMNIIYKITGGVRNKTRCRLTIETYTINYCLLFMRTENRSIYVKVIIILCNIIVLHVLTYFFFIRQCEPRSEGRVSSVPVCDASCQTDLAIEFDPPVVMEAEINIKREENPAWEAACLR